MPENVSFLCCVRQKEWLELNPIQHWTKSSSCSYSLDWLILSLFLFLGCSLLKFWLACLWPWVRFPWVLWSLESSFLASHLMKVQNLASVLSGRCGAFNAGLSSRGTFLLNIIRLSSFIYLSGLEEICFLTGLYVLGSENSNLRRFQAQEVHVTAGSTSGRCLRLFAGIPTLWRSFASKAPHLSQCTSEASLVSLSYTDCIHLGWWLSPREDCALHTLPQAPTYRCLLCFRAIFCGFLIMLWINFIMFILFVT